MRSIDADGILTVEMSRISKANICPYKGSEIPGWQELSLDPNRIYKLFRDPKELEKGASTADGKPLLIRHVAITADLPNKSLWVGTLGACTFEAPYLITRPLTVITKEAQDLIDEDEQRELSAGYRYDAEMVPGVYGGEAYDGVMRNIRFNHVALVTKGRAGPDVHVADELPPELLSMKHGKRIARLQKRIPALAALSSTELLALDAELGETTTESVVKLSGDEEKAACDAALEEKRKTGGADAELTAEERESAVQKARDMKAKDAKPEDMKGKDESEEKAEDESEEEAEDEEEEKPKAKAKDKAAKDADPDHRKDFNSIKQGKDKGAKDKAHDTALAMDAAAVQRVVDKAVARATNATADKVRTEQRALAVACDEVLPLVGKVQIHAFDSADEVYAYALEKAGVEVEDDFPAAGYRALVKNEVKHRSATRKPAATKLGMDGASKGFDAETLFQRAG